MRDLDLSVRWEVSMLWMPMSSDTLGRFCLLSNNGHQMSGTSTPLFLFRPGLAALIKIASLNFRVKVFWSLTMTLALFQSMLWVKDLRVTFRPQNTLRKCLVAPKDKTPLDKTPGLIYHRHFSANWQVQVPHYTLRREFCYKIYKYAQVNQI